jgi:hypothetical protein
MSHIDSCYYKSKVEKVDKVGNKTTYSCTYELLDGGFVTFKEVREFNKEDEEPLSLYGGKVIESYSKASDTMPQELLESEKESNLSKLIEYAKKQF